MSTVKNYYDILEIPSNATLFDIEKAYQKLSGQWHPDKHRQNRRNAQIRFNEICEAYETLSDRNKRFHYDELLHSKYSFEDANKTFDKFFEKYGVENQHQKKFFEQHFPERKRNYYDVLEIPRNASFEQIKAAYRRLALKYHPKNNPGSQEAYRRFVEINEAFEALSNESRRQNYDDLIFQRKIAPVRAQNIFEDFWGNRIVDLPQQQQFFKPILKKKWSRNIDRLMDFDDGWRDITNGQTVKTSTVYSNNNGVETKKTVSTKRRIQNGIPVSTTTQQYQFPNGTKQVRKIRDDGRGNITTDVYNLRKGQNLPIDN